MALSWWSRLSRRLTALRKGERLDHELDAEIRLHLDLEAESWPAPGASTRWRLGARHWSPLGE
jgi:hypothetical protein